MGSPQQSRLTGSPPAKGYSPRPAPSCSPGFPALPGTTEDSAGEPQSRGVRHMRVDLPLTHLNAFPVHPSLLLPYLSTLPASTSTHRASCKRRALFPSFPTPRGSPLNRKIPSSLRQSTFSPFCCRRKAALPYKACGQQSAGMSGVKLAFPFS